jgi:hypothetical protein
MKGALFALLPAAQFFQPDLQHSLLLLQLSVPTVKVQSMSRWQWALSWLDVAEIERSTGST